MYEFCNNCGNVFYLEGETGTPENFYFGECKVCGNQLTVRENVITHTKKYDWNPSNIRPIEETPD